MKKILLIILFSLIPFSKWAQDKDLRIGEWRHHFSFRDCFAICETPENILGAAEMGIIMYNKKSQSITSFTKFEGLSDYGLSAMAYHPEYEAVVIGYTNGNIDILKDGKIYNINDLKLVFMTGSKKINHIYFDLRKEKRAYLSTGFGVLEINIDVNKPEIVTTWYIGDNASNVEVYQLLTNNDFLYAATNMGVKRAAIGNDFSIYTNWETEGSVGHYCAIALFDNKLIKARGEKGTRCTIEGMPGTPQFSSFKEFFTNDDNLILVLGYSILVYNKDFIRTETITSPIFYENQENFSASFNSVLINKDNEFWVTDNNQGLLKRKIDSEFYQFTPEGPVSNRTWEVKLAGDNLWVIQGGKRTTGAGLWIPSNISILTRNGWQILNQNNTPELKNIYDIISIAIHPKNPDNVFINTWGYGVLEFDRNGNSFYVKNHLKKSEEGLQNVYGEDPARQHFVKIRSSLFDGEKNMLLMTNCDVSNGLVGYFPEDQKYIRYTYQSLQYINTLGPIIKHSLGDYWMFIERKVISGTGGNFGVFVWNDNNTPRNQTDDTYKGGVHPQDESSEKRNKGQLLLFDNLGEKITDAVFSMVEDRIGDIWLGTNSGVLLMRSPHTVLYTEKPYFSRIKVPFGDGSDDAGYLLEYENITAIAVDGGNRKWFGTEMNGIFLVSPDGQHLIASFDMKNSNLPSNNIYSIDINPNNGEVFVATDKGLVSFRGLATESKSNFKNAYAFPNPVRPGYSGNITITNLMEETIVKITDIAGKLVYETKSIGGQAHWDGRNLWGTPVKSGVYLAFLASPNGEQSHVIKIAIVR